MASSCSKWVFTTFSKDQARRLARMRHKSKFTHETYTQQLVNPVFTCQPYPSSSAQPYHQTVQITIQFFTKHTAYMGAARLFQMQCSLLIHFVFYIVRLMLRSRYIPPFSLLAAYSPVRCCKKYLTHSRIVLSSDQDKFICIFIISFLQCQLPQCELLIQFDRFVQNATL